MDLVDIRPPSTPWFPATRVVLIDASGIFVKTKTDPNPAIFFIAGAEAKAVALGVSSGAWAEALASAGASSLVECLS